MRRAVTRRGVQYKTNSAKKVSRNTAKPNFRLLASLFFCSVLIGCGVSFVLQTPSLAVKSISVNGVSLGNKVATQEAAKYALEKNIILVNKGPALRKIAGFSEVAQVEMGRTLPNRLWIRVWERKPSAVVTNGKEYFMVDSDGLAFHKVNGPVKGITLIAVDASEKFGAGRRSNSSDMSFCLNALNNIHRRRMAVTKITIDHDGNMCLNMDRNFCVKLGQPDEIASKIAQVKTVLEERPSFTREAMYIDASCPRAIVWKPRYGVLPL